MEKVVNVVTLMIYGAIVLALLRNYTAFNTLLNTGGGLFTQQLALLSGADTAQASAVASLKPAGVFGLF